MLKVIIESPYAGEVQDNIEYARQCVKDSLSKGEAPIASHLLYTQPGILDDTIEDEREKGIDAGLTWMEVADKVIYYIDNGMSGGMKYSLRCAKLLKKEIEYRKLDDGMISIDDRAICFNGTFPSIDSLLSFKPWNK